MIILWWIVLSAICLFRGTEILIQTSRDATIVAGDELRLTSNGTVPRINGGFDPNMPGVKYAQGNVTLANPEDTLPPEVRIFINPGEWKK